MSPFLRIKNIHPLLVLLIIKMLCKQEKKNGECYWAKTLSYIYWQKHIKYTIDTIILFREEAASAFAVSHAGPLVELTWHIQRLPVTMCQKNDIAISN